MAQPGYGDPPNPTPQQYGAYPPAQGAYPPAEGAYPPPLPGYPPPQQQGFAPAQPGYAIAPPINQQPGYPPPGQEQWMPAPAVIPNCPPAFFDSETNNKYKILNSMGQQVFFAAEDTDSCTGQEMKILDNMQREVIHLTRPLRCSFCLFPCCLQEIEVQSPPGTVIGYCVQNWSILIPKFEIQNAARETVLRIEGPSSCQGNINICADVEFDVLSADGQNKVGKISKQWTGLVKEVFTDAENFGISFPMDLDATIKGVILGSCFLITKGACGD
ncbi:phospholipid scramblase 2-like isoform X2 [Acropora millepora]|uniref:phospholipid scramblase 2-like isoform X2 n=1 Tax=Acropora millepora TaxID=45264 RepID=UPI0010FCCC90|nr:phospholipid scramblase 2-like isoform X2 [Acropora millepora]